MLRVDHDRWNQTLADLHELALRSNHRRTRERFLALFQIAGGTKNATQVALMSGRNHQTVQGWVRRYNTEGPDALVYSRSGGRPPFVPR